MKISLEIFFIWTAFLLCSEVYPAPCHAERRCGCSLERDVRNVDCRNVSLNITDVCGLCNKIHNITALSVSENSLNSVPDSCFSACHQLVKLDVSSNNLTWLNKGAFNGLSKLKTLYLNNNLLVKSNGGFSGNEVFKPLKALEVLHLQNNTNVLDDTRRLFYLSNLEDNELLHLRQLFLDGLPYASFSVNFLSYKSLESIDFSRDSRRCNITQLTNRSFENLLGILSLNLSDCNIGYIDAGTFSPLNQLTTLNLSYNMALGLSSLRNISYGLQFTNIQVLDFSKVHKTFGLSTMLRICDLWFLQNTSLKEIHLDSNRIALIESNALYLMPPSLESFTAVDNLLSFGPYALQGGCLRNLKRLDLSKQYSDHKLDRYNKELNIHEKENILESKCEIPINVSKPNCPYFDNKPLDIMNYSFPSALENFTFRQANLRYQASLLTSPLPLENNIVSIDLSGNILFNWSGSFVYLKKMKHIDLSENFCTDLNAEFFENAPNLESLQASNNKIGYKLASDTDGKLFKPLRNLRKMNLSNNWIEHLPDSIFNKLQILEVLDLSFNRLETVNFIQENMRMLVELYLKQNKISTLPLKLLKQIDTNSKKNKMKVIIDVSDNEININCNNVDFLTWMREHKEYFRNINIYTFRTESGHIVSYNDAVASLRTLQTGCLYSTTIILVSCVMITSFFAIIIGGICYRYRWRLRYFYYMTKARYLGYIPVRNDTEQRKYPFDAFISYCHEDVMFVKNQMIPKIEDEAGMSLCVHQRDFIPGHYIAENILQAIKESRFTIVLLSPKFLDSKWCIYEFNMARMESIYSREGENNLLVVMFKEINITSISQEMRLYLESESFLKFPTEEAELPYFWQMLINALGGSNS